MTMYLKLKAISAHPAVGLQGNTIISTATEQLALEKSETRINGHSPNGSEDGFVKYFSEVQYVG